MTTITNILAPAHLLVGNTQQLEELVTAQLQHHFCKQNSCGQCTTCTQIQAKQFHSLHWVQPEKLYTLELLEPIFETIAFAQEPDHHFFFVLAHAELLGIACANRLLKIVEEPPAGYHFIFLTHRPHHILATIRSRCIITNYASAENMREHPLLEFFTQHKPDVLLFVQTLDAQAPSEPESIELIDQLLTHWYLHIMKNQNQPGTHKITLLQTALKQPPMTGGSKLFWRNLFIQWYT